MTARQPPPDLQRTLRTSVCEVTLDNGVAGRPGPAIVCVRGVWAPRTYMLELFDLFPDTDIVIGDLPGMWTNAPKPSTAAQFSRAFDEVIGALLPGRDVLAIGLSTGALVTLGLSRPEVRAQLLMEPFLTTANLWPLVDNMRHRLRSFADKPTLHNYIWDLFGYAPDRVEERDYGGLLEGVRVPIHAVFGDLPLLPPRTTPRWPSLSDEATRSKLAAAGARTYAGPPASGHHVTEGEAGWAVFLDALRRALADAGGR